MLPTPSPRPTALVTFEEFCRLVPDGAKADLLDGEIVMASPDSIRSNRVMNFVLRLGAAFVEERGLGGEWFTSRVAFRLGAHGGPEPDVAYVAAERLERLQAGFVRGAPDLAVEVVSEDSRERDYETKRRLYESSDVREYWLIDPLAGRVEFLVRGGAGGFAPAAREDGVFRSRVLPGLWLDPAWLLAERPPSPAACLAEILGRQA